MTEHFDGMFAHPKDYVPYKLFTADGAVMCKWLTLLSGRFTDPFFSDTVRLCEFRAAEKKLGRSKASTLETMARAAEKLAPVSPAVVIFHLSRCGSTLVSQALASSPRFCVLSEVPFFDELLRHQDIATEQKVELLPAALRFYGLKRYDSEEHVIIKVDCWHIFFFDVLRSLFPRVPFVLMYRNPAEVLTSLLKKPGQHIIPELVPPEIFGLSFPEFYGLDSYGATVIEKLLEKFINVAKTDKNTMLANYNEGAIPIVKKIAAFSKLELTGAELQFMEERSRYHSKRPAEWFNKEPVADVPEYLTVAMRLYGLLEAKRMANRNTD
jgi:hypothetical protein